MFERFTKSGRDVVAGAQEHSRRLDHGHSGTEHLLLSLLDVPGVATLLSPTGQITTEWVDAQIIRILGERAEAQPPLAAPVELDAADAEALRAIGIDLDEVRARIEENFGPVPLAAPPPAPEPEPKPRWRFGRRRAEPDPQYRPSRSPRGHIPFTPRSKKVIELSLREALSLKQTFISEKHLLLGMIREGDGLGALILARAGVDFADLRRRTEAALREAA
jgi:hypothetical protein